MARSCDANLRNAGKRNNRVSFQKNNNSRAVRCWRGCARLPRRSIIVNDEAGLFSAKVPTSDVKRPRCAIAEAASTKQDVVANARAALGRNIARFVPAHPVAGAARSGASAASATLFEGRTVIVTPSPETDSSALERVRSLWLACGARVEVIDAEAHDRIFAAISHLPHLLAFAYMSELAQRPDAAQVVSQAGTGFRDFTRIAAASPEMWRDIALANQGALRFELRRYRDALARLSDALDAGDGAALERIFARSQAARREWEAAFGNTNAGEE